jgi:hypothetical protein
MERNASLVEMTNNRSTLINDLGWFWICIILGKCFITSSIWVKFGDFMVIKNRTNQGMQAQG